MPRTSVLAFAFVQLFGCGATPLRPSQSDEIDRIVERHLAKSRAPGFAVGVIHGRSDWARGYGRIWKDVEGKPQGDTVYEIGSVTKVFTTFVLADMAQEGLLKLNDPIRLYLPADVTVPRSAEKEILLSHLASHRSGLPRLPANLPAFSDDPYANYGTERLYDFLKAHRLRKPIDEGYEYSNLGMGLLGHLLERAGKKPYEQLVIDRLAKPLGMDDTRITLTGEMKKRLAPGYDASGKQVRNWNFDALAGAGALRSTVNDMLKFLAANLGRGDSRLAGALASCHAVRPEGEVVKDRLRVGLAWHQSPLKAGGKWVVWHNGGTGGYSSFIGLVKETGTAVVVLANGAPAPTSGASPADEIGFEILEKLNQ